MKRIKIFYIVVSISFFCEALKAIEPKEGASAIAVFGECAPKRKVFINTQPLSQNTVRQAKMDDQIMSECTAAASCCVISLLSLLQFFITTL